MTESTRKAKPVPVPVPPRIPNAWIVSLGNLAQIENEFTVIVRGLHTNFQTLLDGDALVFVEETSGNVIGFAGIYRVRLRVNDSTIYVDRLMMLDSTQSTAALGIIMPSAPAAISRLDLPSLFSADLLF